MTTEREGLADQLDSLEGSDHELNGFAPVRARVSKTPRAVVSIRLRASELQEISTAAEVLERNVSEFIREAALREARQVQAGVNEARDRVIGDATAR